MPQLQPTRIGHITVMTRLLEIRGIEALKIGDHELFLLHFNLKNTRNRRELWKPVHGGFVSRGLRIYVMPIITIRMVVRCAGVSMNTNA